MKNHIPSYDQFVNENRHSKNYSQEVVYMAPKNRASLQKYNEKIAKIVSDEGNQVTIKFEDGKTLAQVPKEQLRYIK